MFSVPCCPNRGKRAIRSHLHRATALAAGFTFLIGLAFAGNVPDEFRDLFIHLNT